MVIVIFFLYLSSCHAHIMLELYNQYQKFARNSLDFAKASKLFKSTNRHAGAFGFVGASAYCPIKKMKIICQFTHTNLLDY